MKADNKVFKKINQLITRSVSGDMFDQKEFAVTFFTSGKETLTKLLPKDKTLLKYIKEIHLFFSPDATVGRVKLIEPTDDYTEITFTHQQFNTPIDEATFKLSSSYCSVVEPLFLCQRAIKRKKQGRR